MDGTQWPAPTPAAPASDIRHQIATGPAATESDFLKGVQRDVAGLLVRKYHQACQQGRTADAKKLVINVYVLIKGGQSPG